MGAGDAVKRIKQAALWFLCILVIGGFAFGVKKGSDVNRKVRSSHRGTLTIISPTGEMDTYETRGIVKPTTAFIGRPYRYDFRDAKTGRKQTVIVSESDRVEYVSR